MTNRLLNNLNEQQIDAVKTTEGYVRVIAGAGSGKTKALTSRFAYIVEELGVSSSNILCVTFTNKAAEEMRKRVKALIGDNADVSLISTYHGFCVRVLREDINKILYPKSFIIMDVEDQKTILREVFAELNLTSKDLSFKTALREITVRKSSLEYLEYILEGRKDKGQNEMDRIFQRYIEKQQRNFALDFDDLMNYAIYIFKKHEDVLVKWQKRICYIQVDEVQDSSEKQFSFIEMLSQINKNLFIVGDPDQTIYEWRGATPKILVDFDKYFPDTKTIIMNQNYRSTPNILNLGNHIIKRNTIRVDKDMFTENVQGVDVVHFHGSTETEESLWVVNEIKELVKEKNAKYSDAAILYRANHVSRSIEQALIKENIPYTIYGGIRFFERREIKDILAYLRLLEFGDDFSFLQVINLPTRGLGRKFIENVSKYAELSNASLFNALIENINQPELIRSGALEFIKLIDELKILKRIKSISDLVKDILDKSGLTKVIRADGDEDRLNNIKEFVNSIILLENESGENISLEEYLQEISLFTNMDLKDGSIDKVKLMTIHTSKGLEFPYVFLSGFSEGILPSAMSISERTASALEEERRLTYVAITRAEKGFYITESEGYNFNTGSNKYPSRFLFEINEAFYVRKGTLRQEVIEEAKQSFEREKEKLALLEKRKNLVLFSVGDHVNHPILNKGRIIEVNEIKGEYTVLFEERNVTRPINFLYGRLEKIEI